MFNPNSVAGTPNVTRNSAPAAGTFVKASAAPANPAPSAAPAPAPKPAAPALDISAQKDSSEYKSYWGKHDVYESKSGKSLEKFLKEDFNGKKS